MTEVATLDAREAAFLETEAATVSTIATGLQTGRDGFLLAWSGMAVLLHRSHSNLAAKVAAAGEKPKKAGLPSGYITRLAGYLAAKTVAGENSVRQYLSALNQLVDKASPNADATIRAICSSGDTSRLAEHFKAKGLVSWAEISAHARRNSEGGGNKEPKAKRLARSLKEQKPTDIVEALLSLPNISVIFEKLAKAMAKAPKAKAKR